MGTDGVASWILKECAEQLVEPVHDNQRWALLQSLPQTTNSATVEV